MGVLIRPMHLLVLLVIVLIIFGPGKLPDLGSAIGKAIRGFKKSMEEPEHKPEDTTDTKKSEEKKE
jgi:sec-independent protein translocase protein TatA